MDGTLFSENISKAFGGMPEVPQQDEAATKAASTLFSGTDYMPPSIMKGVQEQRERLLGRQEELGKESIESIKKSAQELSGLRQRTTRQIEALEKPEPVQDIPKQDDFGKSVKENMPFFVLMAVLGGMATRQPFLNATNAMTAAMMGLQQGNQEKFKRKLDEWKMHTEIASQKWQRYKADVDDILRQEHKSHEEILQELKLKDAEFGVQQKQADRQIHSLDQWVQEYDRQQNHWENLQLRRDQMQAAADARTESITFRQEAQAEKLERTADQDRFRNEQRLSGNYQREMVPYRKQLVAAQALQSELEIALKEAPRKETKRAGRPIVEFDISPAQSEKITQLLKRYYEDSRGTQAVFKRLDEQTGGLIDRHLNNINRFLTGKMDDKRVQELYGMVSEDMDKIFRPMMQRRVANYVRRASQVGVDPMNVIPSEDQEFMQEGS